MKLHRFVPVMVVPALLVLFPAAPAEAQDRSAKKVEDINRMAMEEYDLLEFEAAKKKLNEAIVLIKKSRLDKHPVAARTHVNLGIVYGGGLEDEDNALLEFIRALEIDSRAQLDPAYKTPQLEKLFAQAVATVGGGGGGGSASPADISGMKHTLVDEAPGGKPIEIAVQVGDDVGASQVVLYYRPQGKSEYNATPMKNTGGATYKGTIPAEATGGDSLQYYIQAKNSAGKVAASNGTSGSPNIVLLTHGGGALDDGRLDDEDPLAGGGGGGVGEGGGTGDTGVRKVKRRTTKSSVFLTIAAGTGGTFVSGTTEQARQEVGCCLAPAPFHITPEVGFWLTPQLTLSVYGRIGFPLGANIPGHAVVSPAGLLRVSYALTERGGGLALHGDVGGGFVRSTVKLEGMASQSGDTDTHATGPLLVGGGANWIKELSGPLRFVADLNILAGIPVVDEFNNSLTNPEFGVSFDLTLGLSFAF